jgi:Calx-beta domain/RTX calcium-binding nonapeptide repeat (4 copies)
MRRIALAAAVLALAGALAASVGAGTQSAAKNIVGTAKSEVLKGTSKADVINGKAGNDKLFGLGGNDALNGGAGNDKLVGGPGKDSYQCGAGKDVVVGDASDAQPGADCEVVTGIPKPAISVADASGKEGNSGTTTLNFTVTLSKASTQTVSVSYATADGTATASADYQSASGKLTFAPGQKSKTVDVAVVGETAYEQDETFTVTLSNPVNATIADGAATGTIQNDDTIAMPGHYKGTDSQNELFEFDVTADGAGVTGIRTGQVNESCSPGGSLSGGNLDFGSDVYPISAEGYFSATGVFVFVVSGAPAIDTVTITGKFSGASASGTFLSNTVFTLGGTHYSCTSGNQTWNATHA